MPTVTEVRDDLAAVITTGTGLRAAPLVQDIMVAPIAVVSRRPFDPRMVLQQAKAAYQFTVTIYVDRTDERAAQRALDTYCELSGTGSVIAAIQTGSNWSVTVDYAQVTQVGDVTPVVAGESNYLIVQLDVEVVF